MLRMAKRWFKSQISCVPPKKPAACFGSSIHSLPGAPIQGQKQEKKSCTYMLSGIASGLSFARRRFRHQRMVLSCAGHSRSEDCDAEAARLGRSGGSGQRGLLSGSYPSGWPLACCRLRSLHYFRVARPRITGFDSSQIFAKHNRTTRRELRCLRGSRAAA